MSDPGTPCWVRVVLDVPLFAQFDYRSSRPVPAGTRVIVPFGRRKMVGVVVDQPARPGVDVAQIRDVDQVLDDTDPLPASWLDRKSTRLNSSHVAISYAVFCLKN